jgi:hypothetical protein
MGSYFDSTVVSKAKPPQRSRGNIAIQEWGPKQSISEPSRKDHVFPWDEKNAPDNKETDQQQAHQT